LADCSGNDSSFNPETGSKGDVGPISIQPDGKILVGGNFDFFNGISRIGIARLNTDGSVDTSFNPETRVTGKSKDIYSIALQSDGKILIVGSSTTHHVDATYNIARLNTDGSLDTSFNSETTGSYIELYSVALQSDGKILIGGGFSNAYYGVTKNYIVRLNNDGSLDKSFNPGSGLNDSISSNPKIHSLVIQSDGKILVGGCFYGEYKCVRPFLARLKIDGSLDTSFKPNGANFGDEINSIAIQPDGKVLIGGNFTSYNNLSTPRICRILNKIRRLPLYIHHNPATSQFTVAISTPTTLQITNTLGQILLTEKVDEGSTTISTANLPSGIYTVLAEGYEASSLIIFK